MFSSYRAKFSKTKGGITVQEKLKNQKKEDYVTQESFVSNLIKIFLGNLEEKMMFTFEMYDFDQDGFISAEDVRIMMSYMPFKREDDTNRV